MAVTTTRLLGVLTSLKVPNKITNTGNFKNAVKKYIYLYLLNSVE